MVVAPKATGLVQPSLDFAPSYLEALAEGFSGPQGSPANAFDPTAGPDALAAHIAALNQQGLPVRLPDGSEVPSVPFSNLWLVAGTVMIGCVSVRHHLTPHLLRLGGHLGYEIRPRYRRLRFGHRALALGIRHPACARARPVRLAIDLR